MFRFKLLSQPAKTTFKFLLAGLIIIISFAIINACIKESPKSPLNNDSTQKNNTNVLFGVTYDEETTVLANQWPSDIIGGLAKTSSGETEEVLLEDYQLIHQSCVFDENGYFSMSTYNIEGDESIRMPLEIYDEVKDEMPEMGADFDPGIGFDMAMGSIILNLKSGDNVLGSTYDPDDYKADPELLDSLINVVQTDTVGVSGRIARTINQLNKAGVQYSILNEEMVSVVGSLNNCNQCPNDFAEVKRVIDLTTGNIIREGLIRQDGKYQYVSFFEYKQVNGFWIVEGEVTYTMGDVNGEWKKKYTTYKHRENINVIYNPISK